MDEQREEMAVVDSSRAESGQVEELIRTCLNCGKQMDEFKCKLVCECGYFASCSDYY